MVAGTTFANPEGVCPDGKLLGKVNIIGVKNDKTINMENKGGGVIFVDLGAEDEPATTEIYLIQGDDFAVLDKNGTDGEASLMLMPTGLDPYIIGEKGTANTMSEYSVFIRALGTPGGKAAITTCGDLTDAFGTWIDNKTLRLIEPLPEDTVCSLEQVTSDILVRNSSKPKFINVTAELLTIVFEVTVDTDPTEVVNIVTFYVRIPIFDSMLENVYWQYDNEGLKNLEIRFYDCTTDVSAGDGPYTPPA